MTRNVDVISQSTLTGYGQTLHLHTCEPSATPERAKLVIIHGYGDHGGRYRDLMLALAAAGISSHAVDLRGQGRSTGPRSAVRHWDDYLYDISTLMTSQHLGGDTPTFVLGHSHGGLIAAVAAKRQLITPTPTVPQYPLTIRGVILASPFFAPAFTIPLWKLALARVANILAPDLRIRSGLKGIPMCRDPALQVETQNDPLICRTATPRWFLGATDAQQEVLTLADQISLPLLLLIGTGDTVADPAAMRLFFARAGSADKTKLEYPGLLHELHRELERQTVVNDILSWIQKRLDNPQP